MHRLFPAAAILVALGSPVHAADSFSFAIGGHWIRISASRYSISPGMTHRHAQPEKDRQTVASSVAPTPPAAAPVASRPAPQPALCSAPLAPLHPTAPQVQPVAPPPVQQPQIQPVQAQPVQVQPAPQIQPVQATPMPAPVTTASITPPPPPQQVAPPVEVTPPQVTNDAPKIAKVSQEIEETPADSPIGDWHAEGQKGAVRIEPCGRSLCGYTVDAATNAKGETILVDMTSKTASKWSGNIYSHDSGNTYYGTMTMKGPDSLHVEACALGHFFCSGTTWRRADAKPKKLISDRETPQPPRS